MFRPTAERGISPAAAMATGERARRYKGYKARFRFLSHAGQVSPAKLSKPSNTLAPAPRRRGLSTGSPGLEPGQSGTDSSPQASAFVAKAAILDESQHVAKVPLTDSCTAAKFPSFNHLVSAGEERGWHGEAQGLGGFQINHQLKFRRLFHG